MNITPEHNAKIAKLTFAWVYPHYLTKILSKWRTENELYQVINWLTGFNKNDLQKLIDDKVNFEEFFAKASLNPSSILITGTICGYKIQEIDNPLTRNVRYLDKLVDELANGKKIDKILRK